MNAAAVLRALRVRGWTLAAAESLTGGLLLATLTEVPGASDVVRGGFVVYATDLKHRLAGVDTALLEREGPVHPDVAAALAEGARERCHADVGVGLTGVAGPSEQHGRPVGTVFIAVATPQGRTGMALPPQAERLTRTRIRLDAVGAALRMIGDACRPVSSPTAETELSGSVGRAE